MRDAQEDEKLFLGKGVPSSDSNLSPWDASSPCPQEKASWKLIGCSESSIDVSKCKMEKVRGSFCIILELKKEVFITGIRIHLKSTEEFKWVFKVHNLTWLHGAKFISPPKESKKQNNSNTVSVQLFGLTDSLKIVIWEQESGNDKLFSTEWR